MVSRERCVRPSRHALRPPGGEHGGFVDSFEQRQHGARLNTAPRGRKTYAACVMQAALLFRLVLLFFVANICRPSLLPMSHILNLGTTTHPVPRVMDNFRTPIVSRGPGFREAA